jgi:hypothetical protein
MKNDDPIHTLFEMPSISMRREGRAKPLPSAFGVILFLGLLGCRGGSSVPPPPPAISVSISPKTKALVVNTKQVFTATITNDTYNKGVTWQLSCTGGGCGILDSSVANPVIYTAPGSLPGSAVTLVASSNEDKTKSDGATITVTQSSSNITVSLTPKRSGLTISQTLVFAAQLTNDTQNLGVTWTATGPNCSANTCGTFTSVTPTTAVYSPPTTAAVYTVTATSKADTTQAASATIGVTDLKGVFSWRGAENDVTRQGVNFKEYALTTSNVNSGTFGKRFSCAVDGFVFAQPLFVANLAISGKGTHNVVYVATENDSLYAFDADDPTCRSVWSKPSVSLLPTGEDHVSGGEVGSGNIGPLVGITGTPVIDPSSNTLYLIAESVDRSTNPSTYIQRLHAIDIVTGLDKVAAKVVTAAVPGAGSGSTGSPPRVSFDPQKNNQRPGLLLLNGVIYIAWASYDDIPIYHGWLIGYDASTLALVAAFSPTPDGSTSGGLEGGIWMSGAAPAADSNGNIYLSVGNGTFDDTTSTVPPQTPNDDFGNSALKLSTAGNALQISSFFTPHDQTVLNSSDIDLGSTGLVLLPDLASASLNHLMFCGGKGGVIYLLDRDDLGKFNSVSDAVVQSFQLSSNNLNGFRSTPAFFSNTMYAAGQGDHLMAVPFDPLLKRFTGNPPSASSQSIDVYQGYGTTPALSALLTLNGIVWSLDVGTEMGTPTVPVILRAYDATNLATKLYDSSQQARDTAGLAVKFSVPTVANGKVYVGTQTELDVYGLLSN